MTSRSDTMGGRNAYLCKKVAEGEIQKLDPFEVQRRISLLNEAPNIITNALARGWISYPHKVQAPKPKPNPSKFVGNYDCLKAYQLRQNGMSIKDLCQFLRCAHDRIKAVLQRGQDLAIQQRLDEVSAKLLKRQEEQKAIAASNTKQQRNNTKRK